MKPREEEILEQITELCRVNEYSHFDISVSALKSENKGFLCFEGVSYSLEELQLTLHDIEWLERLEKISIVHKYRFKELAKDEILRTTYSLYVNVKGPVNYGSLNSDEWSPLTIIAIIGGGLTCIMAIVMVAKRVNIVGYDTNEAGYGYYTLTPYAALIFGVLILFGGIMTMPNKRKK